MTELIERQAAIDAVKCGTLSAAMVYGRTDAGRTALYETVKAIKAIPSAQLTQTERVNSNDALDCISRQEAIEALKKEQAHYTQEDGAEIFCEYNHAIEALENIPPAQPDLQQTCNQLATDCISRQAAIDLAKAHWYKPDIVGAIEQLPPAQPQIVRCKDCVYHAGWNYCEEVDGLWYDDDFCCRGEKGERREE